MTAKELVKQHYPNARHETYRSKGPISSSHTLIWSDYQSRNPKRLGEGDTVGKAWTAARKYIESRNDYDNHLTTTK